MQLTNILGGSLRAFQISSTCWFSWVRGITVKGNVLPEPVYVLSRELVSRNVHTDQPLTMHIRRLRRHRILHLRRRCRHRLDLLKFPQPRDYGYQLGNQVGKSSMQVNETNAWIESALHPCLVSHQVPTSTPGIEPNLLLVISISCRKW